MEVKEDSDPADYLFKETKYHDCILTVGNAGTNEVEEIGVSKLHLVSQSTVFREMLEDSQLADPSGRSIHITDVSPSVFKLMLRHVYGGEIPQVPRVTLCKVLLCADKFNIRSLVKRTCVLLIPLNIEDLPYALFCVTYLSLPELLPHVVDILQERTWEVVESSQFLQLDAYCVGFIAQQEKLAICEVELWRHLVKWAKERTDDPTKQRLLISKPLKHVRLMTLSEVEIIREVMNTNIFSPAELLDLLSAVSNNTVLTVPDLCTTKQKRDLFGTVNTVTVVEESTVKKWIKTSKFSIRLLDRAKGHKVQLESFTSEGRPLSNYTNLTYTVQCTITVHELTSSLTQTTHSFVEEIQCKHGADDNFVIPLPGTTPKLTHGSWYYFEVQFSTIHPAFVDIDCTYLNDRPMLQKSNEDFEVEFEHPRHVKAIKYRTL